MKYKLSWFLKASSHYLTIFLLRFYQKNKQVVFVCGAPRSGTSWVSDVLAFYFNLPRPKHYVLPLLFECVVHTHSILNPKKYHNCFYVIRNGKNSFLSQYYMIKKLMLSEEKFVGKKLYKGIFKDVNKEENTSHNVLELMKLESKKKDNLFEKYKKIHSYKEDSKSSLIIYEEAIENPIKVFSEAITKNTGSCDLERLEKVLELLSKKSQNKLPSKRKSTTINKTPSDSKDILDDEAVRYYEKMISK